MGSLKLGTLSLLDQCIVSGMHFLTAVLVGRFAGQEELGLYSLAFSFIILTICVQKALLLTPYMVYGPRADEESRKKMRGSLLIFFGGLGAVTFLGWLLLAWAAQAFEVEHGAFAIALAFATPAVMLRDLGRRIAFADLRFGEAFFLDAFGFLILLAAVIGVIAKEQLSSISMLLIFAGSSAISGMGYFLMTWRRFAFCRSYLVSDFQRCWLFGRWVALSQMTHTAQNYLLHWILAFTGGVAVTGLYAACWSVVQLAGPFVQGAGNALGPMASRAFSKGGIQGLQVAVRKASIVIGGVLLLYFFVISWVGSFFVQWLYGTEYAGHQDLLILLAATVVVNSIALGPSKGLSLLEFPNLNFIFNLIGLVFITLLALVLGTIEGGLRGAVWGLFLGSSVPTILKWIWYQRIMGEKQVA